MRIGIILLLAGLVGHFALAETFHEFRTWTLLDGRKIEARFVSLEDDTVVMSSADGKAGRIPLSFFRAEDIRILRKLSASRAGPTDVPSEAKPVTARKLRLVRKGRNHVLQVVEVQAFSNSNNIAPNGTASQFGAAQWAKKAIDGNTADSQNTTAWIGRGDDPWWELDFGQDIVIERITLWNRPSFRKEQLSGVTITLLDAQGNTVWETVMEVAPDPDTSFEISSNSQDNQAFPRAGDASPRPDNTTKAENMVFAPEDLGKPRQWRLQTGQSFAGKFLGRKAGMMLIRLADGQPRKLPIASVTAPHRHLVYEATQMTDGGEGFTRDDAPNVGFAPAFNRMEMRLWMPDRSRPVLGIVVFLDRSRVDARSRIKEPAWIEFARHHHLALCGIKMVITEQGVLQVEKDPPAMILRAFDELGDQLGHEEFRRIPLVVYGRDLGGGIGWRMVEDHPDRVRAAILSRACPKKVARGFCLELVAGLSRPGSANSRRFRFPPRRGAPSTNAAPKDRAPLGQALDRRWLTGCMV